MSDEELRRVLGEDIWRIVQKKDQLVPILLQVLNDEEERENEENEVSDGVDDFDCLCSDLHLGKDGRYGSGSNRVWADYCSDYIFQLERVNEMGRLKEVSKYEWFVLGTMLVLFGVLILERIAQ